MDDLVTTAWLADRLGDPDLAIVDCSFFMKAMGRDARAEYETAHIPGARFLDIDAVADRSHPAPHMLPTAADFGAAMEGLGVGRNDTIVCYDHSPLRSAVRGWFMFRHYGAANVAVLDGGMGKWLAEGRPTESGPARARPARFDAVKRPDEVVTKQQLLDDPSILIADARSKGRFDGTEPDPRPGVAVGHRPGALNLPMGELYNPDGTFKPDADLAKAFDRAGLDPKADFAASCGSGVTANSILLAARKLGGRKGKLYDGSWSEWGADPATPKTTGAV